MDIERIINCTFLNMTINFLDIHPQSHKFSPTDDMRGYAVINKHYTHDNGGILFVNNIVPESASDYISRRFANDHVITTNSLCKNFAILRENPNILTNYTKLDYDVEVLDINIKVSNFAKNIGKIKLENPCKSDISAFISVYNQYHNIIPEPQINILLSAFDNIDTEVTNIRNNENLLHDMLLWELILFEYLVFNIVHLIYETKKKIKKNIISPFYDLVFIYKRLMILSESLDSIDKFITSLFLIYHILSISLCVTNTYDRDTLFFTYYSADINKKVADFLYFIHTVKKNESGYTGVDVYMHDYDDKPHKNVTNYTLYDLIYNSRSVDIKSLNKYSIYQISCTDMPRPTTLQTYKVMNYNKYNSKYIIKKDAFYKISTYSNLMISHRTGILNVGFMSFNQTKLILIGEQHNAYNPYYKSAFHTWINADKINNNHKLFIEGISSEHSSIRIMILTIFRNKKLWDCIYDCDGRNKLPKLYNGTACDLFDASEINNYRMQMKTLTNIVSKNVVAPQMISDTLKRVQNAIYVTSKFVMCMDIMRNRSIYQLDRYDRPSIPIIPKTDVQTCTTLITYAYFIYHYMYLNTIYIITNWISKHVTHDKSAIWTDVKKMIDDLFENLHKTRETEFDYIVIDFYNISLLLDLDFQGGKTIWMCQGAYHTKFMVFLLEKIFAYTNYKYELTINENGTLDIDFLKKHPEYCFIACKGDKNINSSDSDTIYDEPNKLADIKKFSKEISLLDDNNIILSKFIDLIKKIYKKEVDVRFFENIVGNISSDDFSIILILCANCSRQTIHNIIRNWGIDESTLKLLNGTEVLIREGHGFRLNSNLFSHCKETNFVSEYDNNKDLRNEKFYITVEEQSKMRECDFDIIFNLKLGLHPSQYKLGTNILSYKSWQNLLDPAKPHIGGLITSGIFTSFFDNSILAAIIIVLFIYLIIYLFFNLFTTGKPTPKRDFTICNVCDDVDCF
jgi:hypothetical protein